MMDVDLLIRSMACKCPRCGKGDLYPSTFDMNVVKECASCGLNLSKNDSADGPAVFMIFVISPLVVPFALLVDAMFAVPFWVHIILWSGVTIGAALAMLKPVKSYIIALQYKHRPGDYE